MNRRGAPKERVKFWRDPALRGLEMLHATYITYSFSPHAHEGFGIAIVESGVMEFDYRGASHKAPAGSVVITHPGEVHTGQAVLETGWTYRTLLPAIDWLQQAAKELNERSTTLPYFSSPVIHDSSLNRHLTNLHRTLETSVSLLEKESHFLWGLTQLIHGYASNRPYSKPMGHENAAVQRVREYLHCHYTRNVPLQELANLVDLSPLRLLRAFRKQIGLPPHAYLNHVRVNQAKQLLASGNAISDTALATGFADQSHLHRHFKKMLGVTPGQYARGCR
ncbi:AraC family transcriptional regulator [Oscillatoria sp. CS-180]|uniref:AraC family transcriptional regulator n=1 Tax=Oscillatoria sp. CS-180 TaxID=3021720 RepID=UPI00232D754A|nr:AraC family transcriptional regulator [Oscillatoria sp. CS-180]MDB9526239.1 AraC family transcriptional regulator [Oscillatoria sp. CS-180]